MAAVEKQALAQADATDVGALAELRSVRVGAATVNHFRLRPGWRWSEHMKPAVAGGDVGGEHPHTGFVIAGAITVRTADGAETTLRAGDAFYIPPGHDAWVLADAAEDLVMIDW